MATSQSTDIRLVALDFDLTIYDHAAPARTRDLTPWFERLHHRGVMVGLASGRTIDHLREPLDEINVPWAQPFPHFVVCNEGSILKPDGDHWPRAATWNAQRRERVLTVNGELRGEFEFIEQWARSQSIPITRSIVESEAGINIVFDTPANAQQALEVIQQRMDGDDRYHMSRNHHIVLALPHGAAKGSAVAHLAEIEGIAPHQVLVIGDNLNDQSMFAEAHGFMTGAPGNADPRIRACVKERGGIVAKAPIAAGVASILQQVFGTNRRPASASAVQRA